MTVRIDAVRMRVETSAGSFGHTVTLAPGMNVLRGTNSRGKTQVVQSVIFALGLERMLTSRANAPLGSAFTDELRTPDGSGSERSLAVVSSWVSVELSNDRGEALTIQRFVKHPSFKQNLVRVWEAPMLTRDESTSEPRDYFVHDSGGATREAGFHTRMAAFFGWQLPKVPRFTGGESLLYVDVIFPFLIVDQQSWGSAGPRKVGRYQIAQPIRKAAEFLLEMTGPAAALERADLEDQLSRLRSQWSGERATLAAILSATGARAIGIPELPAGTASRKRTQPLEATELSDVVLEVLDADEWQPIERAIERLKSAAETVPGRRRDLTNPEEGDPRRAELRDLRRELSSVLVATQLVEGDAGLSEAQVAALDKRLDGLEEERRRNTDVRTLERLGSEVHAQHIGDHNCPTCRQSLDEVESEDLGPTLDIDGNIRLLNAQIATANKMRSRSAAALEQTSNSFAALQRRADYLRVRANSLETDLDGPPAELSRSDVASQITAQIRLAELTRVSDEFDHRKTALENAAAEVIAVRERLSSLPEGIPDDDRLKVEQVTDEMRRLLRLSGFGSYDVSELGLDEEALRPTRAGFDVDTDVSASDVIRTKIAYLQAVRRTAQDGGTHPGILVLDEPRQQDIESASFGAILRYLVESDARSTQTVITSASDSGELIALLGDREVVVNFVDFGSDRLLRPVDEPDLL